MAYRNKGVTLLELLAVFLIIAVIVAILFPVFARAPHGCARCVACSSDERQLGLALLQYAQDNDNRLPSGTQGAGVGWGGQIYQYAKSVDVYHCPDDKNTGDFVSYGYNVNVALHPSLPDYPAPAHTALLFEVAQDTADVTRWDEGASAGATSFSAAGDGTDGTLRAGRNAVRYATGSLGGRPLAGSIQINAPRHTGGSNFLLADGHVKWHKPEEVSSGEDAAPVSGTGADDVFVDAAPTGSTSGNAAGTGDDATESGGYAATFSVK